MQNALHIQASPRTVSNSTAAVKRFLARLEADNPALNVERQNLWELDLPNLDGGEIFAPRRQFAQFARRGRMEQDRGA